MIRPGGPGGGDKVFIVIQAVTGQEPGQTTIRNVWEDLRQEEREDLSLDW